MPDFESWQLLLFPLFFGLGWAAARVDIKHVVRESRALPRSYFQGLNFLLNEEPDRAIEAFCEVVKVDPETIELHFALGSLFRRRGEIERAIRMHQNLVDRYDLADDVKLHALSELGQDFLKVGLLDRAEEIFNRLRGSALDEEARRYLLEIYQAEKEWQKAIDMAASLPDVATRKDIAHYHCELAEADLMRSNPEAAQAHLAEALQLHRQCVRASLLQGDVAVHAGALEDAIAAWQRIEGQNPDYLALAAPRFLDAFEKLGRPQEALQLLGGYLERYPSLDLLDGVYQLSLACEGPEAALRRVREEMRRNPSLLGLDKLLDAQLMSATPDRRGDLELMKNLIHHQTRRLARYKCDNCGFTARQFPWRCPACGNWESYPPRRREDSEPAA